MSQAKREVALIVNLHSRLGHDAARLAPEELARQGVRVVESYPAHGGTELMAATRRAVESGVGTVVIAGGDGTLSSVVDLVAGRRDLALGLLPVGTGNEVARILGIPLDLPGACRVVAEGRPEDVDLAEANGNFFMHTALIGYPAEMNHRMPGGLKLRFGKASYIYALVMSFLLARPFKARISTAAGSWAGETVLVTVGNGPFHTPGRVLLPEAFAGRSGLVAYTPRDTHRGALLRIAVGLWITRRPQPSLLAALPAELVTVEADPPQTVDLDGEYARTTPAGFRVARQALRVLVPRTED